MNNQVDKERLLEWLENEFRNYPAEHMGNYGAGQDMLDMVATKIESGAFDFTPPVPTIKPGDKVKHARFSEPVLVVWAGNEMAVIEDRLNNPYDVFIQDLEVVE